METRIADRLTEAEVVEILRELRKEQKEMLEMLAALQKAFPAEDVEGHRRYHEGVIEWQTLRNKLVRESLMQAAKAGALAAAAWILYAIYIAVKMEFSK